MAVNYIVELGSSFRGVKQLNRFFYKDVVGTLSYTSQLASAIQTAIIPPLQAVTSNSVVYNWLKVSAHNVTSGAEIQRTTLAPSFFGSQVGEALSPFVAWGFAKVIVPAAHRKQGGNRFSGIAEADLSNSDPTPIMGNRLNTLSNALKSLLMTANAQFIPSVARYNPVTKIYTDYQEVIACTYRWVTSQNTRKFGKGD